MKKHWIVLLVCFLVAAAICLAVSWPRGNEGPGISNRPTKPTTPTVGTIGSTTHPPLPGVVRLYVCHREDPAVYEALAQRYSQQTGVECQILTGDLETLMASAQVPTIFCVHSREEAQQWAEAMLDLSGSDVLGQFYSQEFALEMDGKPVGLAMDAESYGLIYNAGLLGASGFTRVDIMDHASLRTAVELITANRKLMGFHGFCQPDLTDHAFAQYMLGISQDPAAIRWFVDLHAANSTATGVPLEQFEAEKVVFYIGGVWEYDRISTMGIHNLDILPLYTEDGGGFRCVCDVYWSVNAQASAEDIQASLAFLNWLVSPGEDGSTPVDSLGWFSPFVGASGAGNAFERLLRKYLVTEDVSVCWDLALGMSDQGLAALTDALEAYRKAPSDETWAKVEALLP